MSSVIPGTSIVIPEPDGQFQDEGRGILQGLHQGHVGPATTAGREFDEGQSGNQYRPGPHNQEAARILDGVLRTLERKGLREERSSFEQIGSQTSAGGSLVLKLHQAPQGWETHVAFCSVDVPNTPSIHASAPYAAATAFAFLAIISAGGDNPGAAAALRGGAFHYWPSPASTTGPILPAEAFWNDTNAPVVYGGETLYYVLSGTAGIANVQLVVNIRMNQYGPA